MDYLPLRVMQNLKISLDKWDPNGYKWGTGFDTNKKIICAAFRTASNRPLDEKILPKTEGEYLRTILCQNFLREPDPVYPEFNEFCRELTPTIMQVAGYTVEYLKSHPQIDIRTELRDLLVQTVLSDKWAMNKQVLKTDGTFAYHLIQTEKLRISKNMISHLPYKTFYVDVSECTEGNIFGDVKGIFVNIVKVSNEEYALALYLTIDQEAMTFSYYNSLVFKDENSDLEIDTTDFTDEEIAHILPQETKLVNNTQIIIKSRNIKVFILQLLCYISIPEADVEMSSQSKKTYHPNTTVKNKFREVCVQDVGIRIGAAITKKKKEAIKQYEESEEYQRQSPKNRKPPIAHFRRAHWHRFWTGVGRKTLITKWVEPTFVCGASQDVIIHKVH